MISSRWVLLALLFLPSAFARGQNTPADVPRFETLDLPAAIQLALLKNRDLTQSRLSVESRELGVLGAEAAFDFSLRPDGALATSSDNETVGYGLTGSRKFAWGTEVSVRGGYAHTEIDDEEDPIDRTTIRLQVTQPLFRNFGPLVQLEPVVQASHNLLTARRLLEQQKADLIVTVVRTFEDLVRLERQVDADETFHRRVNDLYRLTHAREQQGRSTRVDTLRVQLQLGQAESRLTNNRERYASRFQDLVTLLGLDAGAAFTLIPPPLLDLDILPRDELLEVALTNRLEIAQAQQDIEDARRGVLISRRSLQPNLRLVSSVRQFGEGNSFSDSTGLNETAWTVGIAGDTDFVRTREQAAIGRRIVTRESADWQYEIIRDGIRREVLQDSLAYARTRRELSIAENNLKLANDRMRLSRRLFELGRGDNFNVTDAEDAFITAQQQWLGVRADASVAGYRLLRTLGTLVEFPKDLHLVAEATP